MGDHSKTTPGAASFDPAKSALVIEHLMVTDPEVVTEARRWSTGRRGAAVSAEEMAGVDLGAFVTQSLAVGARAIAGAGLAQDTFGLERLVAEVGTKTAESSAQAADATAKSAADASESMGKAANAVRKAITETEAATRRGFTEAVEVSTKMLRDEVDRLLGGENPELLARLGPVLDAAGRKMGEQAVEQTDKLLAKVSRQFDPADPTSPFAKQATALAEQQKSLTESMDKNHLALVGKVEELATAVQVANAAKSATASLAKVTPLKGETYASGIHAVMAQIAVGLGDEYLDTGTVAGAIARSKKGDGLLTLCGGQARVVVEMTDSPRTGWNAYLDEAERNREAVASLGLVREVARNAGHTIRVLGPRRIVMAFDPETDDVDLLQTVVLLLRVGATAASSRQDLEGIQTAQERLDEAMTVLAGLDDITKIAGTIHKSADKISTQGDALKTTLTRILSQAFTALEGAATATAPADPSVAADGSALTGSSDAA